MNNNIALNVNRAIARITLNNPGRHNALEHRDVKSFLQHLDAVETDPGIRVLVIENSEGNTFCAGAALSQLASGELTPDQFAALPDRIAALKIPTIAAINGNAFGGGTEIAISCDFRIGVTHMRIHAPPARIGLCYPLTGIQRFVQRIGVNYTKRLLMANEVFHGPELLQMQFLTHLVNRDELSHKADSLARELAGFAPLAVSAMKQISDQFAAGNLNSSEASILIRRCLDSDDLKEGLAAVIEKRDPVFKGQ